jgi:hypothetical protein
MSGRSFVHSAAVSIGWEDTSVDLSEMIFRTTKAALVDAHVDIDQVDSVVLSAHDLVDGRSLSSMVTGPAAGAYLKDEIRLAEDGLAALSLAGARIEAGEAKCSIVAAWGRASEGNYSRTSRATADPFLVQPFAVDEFTLSSLRLSAWIQENGERLQAREHAHLARAARCARNPRSVAVTRRPVVCYPVLDGDAPRFADIVVAAVIRSAPGAVRVAGFGHSAEVPNIGDRRLAQMPALKEAVMRARSVDGMASAQMDIYQMAGPCLSDEAISLEAIGVARPGEGFDAYTRMQGVNPSGGAESGWCFPTNGLLNFAECYMQLTGQAGGVQLSGLLRRALATGLSPMAGQVAHAVVLEAA